MSRNQIFFEKPKNELSRKKHKILYELLINKAFRKKQLIYIDGLAGAGKYTSNEPGSPLIAINALKKVTEKTKINIDAIFIEKDKNNFKKLETTISQEEIPSLVTLKLINDDVSNKIQKIIRYCSDYPTLLFYDPYGIKEINHTTFKNLRSNPNLDILINFSTIGLNRSKGIAKQNKETEQWLINNFMIEKYKNITLETYLQQLSQLWLAKNISFKNKKNSTIYELILCTNDLNLMITYNDLAINETTSTFDFTKSKLLKIIPDDKSISLKQLYTQIIKENFGEYPFETYKNTLQELIQKHKISQRTNHNGKNPLFITKGITKFVNKKNIYLHKEQ